MTCQECTGGAPKSPNGMCLLGFLGDVWVGIVMQKDHSLCVKALPFVFYCFSQFSKSTAILCGIDSAPLGQELDLKLSTTIEKKRKPSFSMQFLLLSISDVEEMSCVFIAYSFS